MSVDRDAKHQAEQKLVFFGRLNGLLMIQTAS